MTDRNCRPIAFLLTGGQVADCTAGSALLKQMPPARILHGDKGYDSNAIRRQVEIVISDVVVRAGRDLDGAHRPAVLRAVRQA